MHNLIYSTIIRQTGEKGDLFANIDRYNPVVVVEPTRTSAFEVGLSCSTTKNEPEPTTNNNNNNIYHGTDANRLSFQGPDQCQYQQSRLHSGTDI